MLFSLERLTKKVALLALLLISSHLQAQEIENDLYRELIERQDQQIRLVVLSTLVPVTLLFAFIFFFFYRRKRESDFRQKELELKFAKTEMEMRALRAQVNPHFIFNCLNSIRHYIHKSDNEQAERYLVKFSRLIRQVLEYSFDSFISLKDDLHILELYIDLERMRMENSFVYEFHLDRDISTEHLFVPPMLLQPIVENSIWHGLSNRKGADRKLDISFERAGNYLLCEVIDNGAKNANSQNHQNKSFGLDLVRERIALHSDLDSVSVLEMHELIGNSGEYEGMQVRLKIPLEE